MKILAKMPKIASAGLVVIAAAVLWIGSFQQSQATTLATFDVGGSYDYTEDATMSMFTLSGGFFGDASGVGDTGLVRQLVFSADIMIGALPPLSETFGPAEMSIDEAIAGAAFILGELDVLTSGAASAALAYMIGNTGLGGATFDFGVGTLLFHYALDMTPPGTIGGTYFAKITGFGVGSVPGSLGEIVNAALIDEGLTPVFPGGGFGGDFSASFSVAAVPLPATLPLMLVAGGLLVGLRRRRT